MSRTNVGSIKRNLRLSAFFNSVSLAIFSYALGIGKNLVAAVFSFIHLFSGILITFIGIIALSIIGVSVKEMLDFKSQINSANIKK